MQTGFHTIQLTRLLFAFLPVLLGLAGSNAVYNLLPDMLSRMSANTALPEESLRNILQFLIAFLDKVCMTETISCQPACPSCS